MNCYACQYKRNEPGTAHKSCRAIKEHPMFNDLSLDQKGLLEILTLATGDFPVTSLKEEPLIQMDSQGVANGWCYWPGLFDPTWIRDCKFFTPHEDIVNFEKL